MWTRLLACLALVGLVAAAPLTASAVEITGDYIESRSCDIYTGPCFANAQVGLTGHEAVMAWSIDEGSHGGVDLAGLKVIVALKAADTLGFGGGVVVKPDPIRSVVITDERANPEQRLALIDFAKTHAGRVAGDIVAEHTAPIDLTLDHIDMAAKLEAGKLVSLETRKLTEGDCVCTNEVVYYPPLAKVDNAAPAFTTDGKVSGRGLGSSWQNPGTRSSFLATFAY